MRRPTERRPLDRRRDDERDPPRWRQSTGGSAAQKSLGSGVRALPEPTELDDLRLAQIRHRILQEDLSVVRRPILMGWSWPRAAAFALAFLLLGGITTAMAARLYIRRFERTTAPPVGSARATADLRPRDKPRRWRMAVRQPAELEVTLGPDGAEIAVVDGRAEISGAELARPVTLTPGTLWNPGSADAPPAEAHPGNATSAEAGVASPAAVPTTATPPDPVVPNASPRKHPRLAVVTPRPAAPPPAAAVPAPPAPAAALAGLPAITTNTAPVEPQPFRAPPILGSDRSKPSLPIPSRAEPRRAVAPPEGPAEAFLVAGALRSLRSDRAPRDALVKLDEHLRRFPHGALHREATLARVEALLELGRTNEARTVLDSLTLGSTGTDRPARLARAELRADRGDCAGAVDDLNGVLAGAGNDKIADRALYRRARCAVGSRNVEGARVDLRDYLARFPEGSRRSEVEALLRRLGG